MGGTGNRGGKLSKNLVNGGYYGRNTAGQRHEAGKQEYGTKREFKGSTLQTFVFYSESGGTLTIPARSYAEAWRIAKRRGYRQRKGRRK